MKLVKYREGPPLRICRRFVEIRTMLGIKIGPWVVRVYPAGSRRFGKRIVVVKGVMDHVHFWIMRYKYKNHQN